MDIKEIIKGVETKDDVIKLLNEVASKSSNSFWWLKLIAFAQALIVFFENDGKWSGEEKKKLVEEILYPIYDKIKPKKLGLLDTISLGLTKKFICNMIIEGIVFCYNSAFGAKWKDVVKK